MNLPNRLTLSRIFLSLIFIFILPLPGILAKTVSFFIFLVASLTDYWDGQIARTTGQITPLGRFLDPVADKALTFSAFCGFVQLQLVPAWMVVLIVVRDLSITGVRLLMPFDSKKIAAQKSGKHKTVIQFAAILFILSYLVFRETFFWHSSWEPISLQLIHGFMAWVVLVTLYSGVRYLYQNRDIFSKNTSS